MVGGLGNVVRGAGETVVGGVAQAAAGKGPGGFERGLRRIGGGYGQVAGGASEFYTGRDELTQKATSFAEPTTREEKEAAETAAFESSPGEVARREAEARLEREKGALAAQSALRQSRRRRSLGRANTTLGSGGTLG